jgi:hypothetical protein
MKISLEKVAGRCAGEAWPACLEASEGADLLLTLVREPAISRVVMRTAACARTHPIKRNTKTATANTDKH